MSNDLSKAVAQVLDEYEESVTEAVQRVTDDLAKEGLRKIKSSSKSHGWTYYATGWLKKVIVNRAGASATIYNGKVPGLVHLLENGHALRGGGRSRAFPHVAPVQDWLNEELQKRIKEAIQK